MASFLDYSCLFEMKKKYNKKKKESLREVRKFFYKTLIMNFIASLFLYFFRSIIIEVVKFLENHSRLEHFEVDGSFAVD